MSIGTAKARKYVLHYFSVHFHQPIENFKDSTRLQEDLLFSTEALLQLGIYINGALKIHIFPGEIAQCKTIGDLITLVASK